MTNKKTSTSSQNSSGFKWCGFGSGKDDFPTVGSEPFNQDEKLLYFQLCPQAARQLWYVKENSVKKEDVIVSRNNGDQQFKFCNDGLLGAYYDEGYYIFWRCGESINAGVVSISEQNLFLTNSQNSNAISANDSAEQSTKNYQNGQKNSLTTEKFMQVVAFSHDTVQNYKMFLNQKFSQNYNLALFQNEVVDETFENQVKIVAEFVSSLLGGKGEEQQIARLWDWHSQLVQQRKSQNVVDISELKYGTSFHRGTLFAILWHLLELQGTVKLQPPQEPDVQHFPTAKLVIQSEETDFEIDLVEDPGKMEALAKKQIPEMIQLFEPPNKSTKNNPFKTLQSAVQKIMNFNKMVSKRFREQSGDCISMDFPIEVEEKLPRLSTQVYKLRKLKKADLDVQDRIGEGGFGIVFKGKLFDTKVAIKMLKKTNEFETDKQIREQLEHELFMLGWLTHPFIVSLIGVMVPEDEQTNDYGIVMGFEDKGSFYDVVHRSKEVQLPFWRILRIVLNACQAVQFLHCVDVEHRDISSRNILVDTSYRGKLSDFGLSKTRGQIEKAENCVTYQPGNIRYMPPEVLDDQSPHEVDGKSVDAYSIGVVLWEAATKKIPWEGITTAAIYNQVGQQKQQLKLDSVPNDKLRELIEKCWQKDPKDRPKFDEICKTLGGIVSELAMIERQLSGRRNTH